MKKALLIFAAVCLTLCACLTAHAQTNPPAGSNLALVPASSWTNTTGSLTTTGISDPNGGTNAGRLSNGASQATTFAVHSLSQTVAVGDVLMAGVWTRINSGSAGTGFPGTISASGCTATYAATGYSSTLALPVPSTTSTWTWTSVAVKVITVSSNPCLLSLSLVSAASAATDFYAPVFFYVPVGTMQDNAILVQSQNLQNYSLTCTTPSIAAPPSGCLPTTAQNALGVAGANPQMASYTFYVNGGTAYARNNSTGNIDFSGTDAATVINSVLVANATVGGHLFFKNGIYNLNSFTNETATGCSTFTSDSKPLAWAIGIPANGGGLQNEVMWAFEGEVAPNPMGESGATVVPVNGVIFNVTSTAVSGATSGAFLNGFFQRPNTNCTLSVGGGFGNVSNDVKFKHLGIRFPTNQRGNEIGINPWFAASHEYDTVVADFNLSANSIATGSAPVVGTYGSFGLGSTVSGSGNWQEERNTWAVGWNICYDWESELETIYHANAIYCNYAAEIGRAGTSVFHPFIIHFFTDQENLNGILLGPQMVQGSRVDVIGYDIELGAANWYARTNGNVTETNPCFTSGIWTYGTVLQNTGVVAETPAGNLFSTSPVCIQTFEGTRSPNIQITPANDTFTRANAATLGPAWVQTTTGTNAWAILSNAAVPAAGNSAGAVAYYAAQPANNDQLSQVIGSTLATTNQWGAGVRYQTAGAPNTSQSGYLCISLGTASNTLQIYKATANSYTTLGTAVSYTASSGDVLEFEAIGTNLRCSVYRSGSIISQEITTDATYASGQPWIYALKNGAAAVPSLTGFFGGSLPTKAGTDSIYIQPAVHPSYATLSNCAVNSASPAACGSAAAGAVVIPTTTATYTVNTTAVTAHSRIQLTWLTFAGDLPSAPTCVTPSATTEPTISAISAGVSFTIALTSTTGQTCPQFTITN